MTRTVREGGSLTERVVHAGFWALGLRVFARGLGIARTIIIARLLSPDDLGLFGVALLAISALEAVSQTGFRQALVQTKRRVGPDLPSAWTVQVLRHTALAVVLFLAAPWIAAFFDEPTAALLVRAVSVAVLVKGFENIGTVRFQKDLAFDRQFALDSTVLFVDLVASVCAAIILRSAWALVIGFIAGAIARTTASYVLSSYRPRWMLRLGSVRRLYRYGRWVLLNQIIHFLALQGDDVLVGRFLGSYALGIYQLAFNMSELVARQLTSVVSSVTFPTFAKMQEDRARARRAYLLTLEAVASLTLPLTVASVFLARPLVLTVLGEQWLPVASVFPILITSATLRGIVATGGGVYMGLGEPRVSFQISALRVVALFGLAVPLLTRYGLEGIAVAVLLSTTVTVPFFVYHIRRMLNVRLSDLGRGLLPGALLGSVVAAPFAVVEIAQWPGRAVFGAAALCGIGVYVLASMLLWHRMEVGPVRIVRLMRLRSVT